MQCAQVFFLLYVNKTDQITVVKNRNNLTLGKLQFSYIGTCRQILFANMPTHIT